MREWFTEIQTIASLDPLWREKARAHLKDQTRPEGSLGILESLLERLVAIQRKEIPSIAAKRIYIFAGDHGVAEEGVSLYPREVTKAMVLNFLKEQATVSSIARYTGAQVRVVDVGGRGLHASRRGSL